MGASSLILRSDATHRVSKDEGIRAHKKPSWFETPLARLLTMRTFVAPSRGPKHTGEARKRDRAVEPSRGPK